MNEVYFTKCLSDFNIRREQDSAIEMMPEVNKLQHLRVLLQSSEHQRQFSCEVLVLIEARGLQHLRRYEEATLLSRGQLEVEMPGYRCSSD
jgi:hypothetical protein